MNFGLAIPYTSGGDETWVISFLSALRTPIARRFEIWLPGSEDGTLKFGSGYCSSGANLEAIFSGKIIRRGEGSVGQAFASISPVINLDVTQETSIAARAAAKAGLRQTVVLPVLSGSRFQAAIAWYP
jgi:hypothetical protein